MKSHYGLLSTLALSLSFGSVSAHAATDFDGTRYMRQTDAKHTQTDKGVLGLDATAQQLSFSGKDQQTVLIPYGGTESIRFENTVDRLRRPFNNRVGRDQFLTIQYHAAADQPQYAVFKLNGRNYHEVLAALESQTKKQIDYRSN